MPIHTIIKLRALSYRLGVLKHYIDCIIKRLETGKHYRYLDYKDFHYDYIRPVADKFESLDYAVKSAMKEVKG